MSTDNVSRLERIVCAVTFDVPAYLNARREQATSTLRAAYLAWTGSTLLDGVYVPQHRRPVATITAESDYSGRRVAS